MAKAWMRILSVSLTSTKFKKRIVFGENYLKNEDDLAIQVTGKKGMSSTADSFVVRISNLSYQEIVTIINGEFYDIEIKAGYRGSGAQTIFKGGVLYISNELTERMTNTVIIICASELVAKYGQSRINLTINSGVNMYGLINFVLRRAGIRDATLSTQLKKKFIDSVTVIDDNPASFLDKLAKENSSFITNTDGSLGGILSVYDADLSNQRVIELKSDSIDLSGGYPQLTDQGLTFTLQPTISFMCGDVIKLDNSLIDISVSNRKQVAKNYPYYLDKDGVYMVFEQNYNLSNRESSFSLQLLCKSRSLISKFSGK